MGGGEDTWAISQKLQTMLMNTGKKDLMLTESKKSSKVIYSKVAPKKLAANADD